MTRSLDQLFEDFKTELQQYPLQTTNPHSELYKGGARFTYIIPDHLWMDIRRKEQKGKELTTQVFVKINPDLIKHVGEFYKQAKTAAEKLGKKVTYTEPTGAAGGVLVIYVGMK